MLQNQRVYPTLPAADLARARDFYATKLGLTPSREEPGGLFYDCGAGSTFLLFPSQGTASGGHTQLGWSVDDIAAEVTALKAHGVIFEEYDFPGLKTEGSIATTGSIKAAWFKDSEGNLLGLAQF
jgi:catechol 2,3-dioxygenase-like lactoylglutathione lyase family enzyme